VRDGVTRILIADDREEMRTALKTLFAVRPHWEICGEAEDGQDAVRKATQLQPDLIVLDFRMPRANGLLAASEICKTMPAVPIVMYTLYKGVHLEAAAKRAGVRRVVAKQDGAQELLGAMEAELVGDRPADRLSPRERQVIQLLAGGKTNKEIAATLKISFRTVETHRARVMIKLGLHSIVELVRYAVRNNLI
jgi:DNA-binding NarL/FixJ family response regulator